MNELHNFLNHPLAMKVDAASNFIHMASQYTGEPTETNKAVSSWQREAYAWDAQWGVVDLAAAVGGKSRGITAVVPLFGPLSMHGGWLSQSSKAFANSLRQLDASEAVSTIVVHVNSPGGTVSGTQEAATALRSIREAGNTDTIAVVEPMMASAATWIGTAAREVVVTPSGEAGSIGVIAVYMDQSKLAENMGIKFDVMRFPDKKARFSGVEPMTAEMRQHVETQIAADYDVFVAEMAKNRGVTKSQVIDRFGGGEMMGAEEAREAGLVDRIATLEEVLAGIGKAGRPRGSRRRANQLAIAKAQI